MKYTIQSDGDGTEWNELFRPIAMTLYYFMSMINKHSLLWDHNPYLTNYYCIVKS